MGQMEVAMRDFGIVALLSVIATAAAPTAPASSIQTYATSKSTQQFADCYRTHEWEGSRLWYAADRRRTALSNLGTTVVRQPYFIEIRDRGTLREILLRGAALGGPEAQGVSRCL